MDWHTGSNPWAPGGRMTAKSPWAQQGMLGMQYGWQQAGGFFTPKSDAQIRREGLLQLAILAAVVVAPTLIGAAGGGAAGAGGAAASGGVGGTTAGLATTTTMVESGTLIGSAATTAVGTSGLVTAGATSAAATSAALLPFTGVGALAGLLGAAAGGQVALNQALQQRAPAARPSFVFDPGAGSSAEAPADITHPAMPLLDGLAGRIGKNRMLELNLRRALMTGNVTALLGQPNLVSMVGEALRDIRPENPWAGGGSAERLDALGNLNLQNDPYPWPLELLDTARNVDYLTKEEKDMVLEINKARYNPQEYCKEVVVPYHKFFVAHQTPGKPNSYTVINETERIILTTNTQEGLAVIEETIDYLMTKAPSYQEPLRPSKGISRAAADHAEDLGRNGTFDHEGSDGSAHFIRMGRYGKVIGYNTETLALRDGNAIQHVSQLIIDDGVPNRGHRVAIFNPDIKRIGVAIRPHNNGKKVSVQDFSNGYEEN